jgi:hypothetical protein
MMLLYFLHVFDNPQINSSVLLSFSILAIAENNKSISFFHTILKIKAKVHNYFYIVIEKLRLRLSNSKPLKILISKKEHWNEILEERFKNTKHTVVFDDINLDNIKKYDLVVALNIPDLIFCIDNNELLTSQLIPIPKRESLDICNNKYQFTKYMVENGFSEMIPNSILPLPYPYILKKKIGEYGQSTYIVSNEKDEKEHDIDLKSEDFMCQEMISGNKEYATHVVLKNGKIRAAVSIRYTYDIDNYVQGKAKYICKEVCESEHIAKFEKILLGMGFEGLCCFDYKVVNGVPKIFEINPRFGGSLTDYFFSFIRKLDK